MACLNEFTFAVYADGELPENEAREVAEHLETCGRCRELVDALETESRGLVQCLQEVDLLERGLKPAATGMAGTLAVQKIAALVLMLAAAMRLTLDLVAGFELPSSLDWLDPMSMSGQLNFVANTVAYILGEGGTMMASIINSVSLAALNTLILFGVFMLIRRSAGTSAMLGVIALLAVFSSSSYALDVRKGNQNVTVPPGETVDDTLVVFGDSVNVEGTVTGDLIAFGRQVNVGGTVKGNVIAFARRIDVNGIVEGGIFGFGQIVDTNGQVARNIYAFAQTISSGKTSHVAGNLTAFGAETVIDGAVDRDLTTFGATLDIRGNVGRNVLTHSERVSILAPAKVGGDLTAHVKKTENVRVDSGATVAGKRNIELSKPKPSQYATFSFYLWQAIWLAAAFITGLILFLLVPTLTRPALDTGRALLTAGGIGFLALIATPVAAIILGITIIGLPIGLIALAFWLLALYLAKIVIAQFLGRALLGGQGERNPSMALGLLVGLVLIFVAVNLPYVGGVINVLLILFGSGALLMGLHQLQRSRSDFPSGSQPAA